MDHSRRKRGRPRVPVIEELIEARRLSKQRRNRQQKSASELTGLSNSAGAQPSMVPITRPGSGLDTPRQRRYIDKHKEEFAASNTVMDIGAQDQTCGYCGALVWAAEFTGRHVGPGPKGYSICCGKGKVLLPLLRPTPPELAQLLAGTSGREMSFNFEG